MSDKITARVYRYDPDLDEKPRFDTYRLKTEMPLTVHLILKKIQEEIDPTLAFRNYTCLSGICGCCEVRVNGKVARGCHTRVDPGDIVLVEPLQDFPLIRDVVVDFSQG